MWNGSDSLMLSGCGDVTELLYAYRRELTMDSSLRGEKCGEDVVVDLRMQLLRGLLGSDRA